MPIIQYTQRDLLRGTIVEPAWYKVKIEEVGEAPSKDQKSTNYPVDATIICNAENGSTKFAGVPIEWNFNSKALGFTKGFLKSGLAPGESLEAETRYELGSMEGKEIEMYIANDRYQNRDVNRVPHEYRPVNR